MSGAPPPVRHSLPSYLLSLDDEPHAPSERLMHVALRAAQRAWETDLSAFAARFGAEMRRYANVWPGEHYRLLAGLMDVLKPRLVVEIGTATGASCLTMKAFLPPEGRIVTYDVVPWQAYPDVDLRDSDFDRRLEQRIVDLSDRQEAASQAPLLAQADLIFVDAAKDGAMEQSFCELFDELAFRAPPIIVFDDIRMINMLAIWRGIAHPKLDLTSFGHWSGTGLVEWGPG